MARLPGTRLHRIESNWALIDNQTYAGKEPRIMVAECHDRTPFITIRCDCGYELHQHESRTAAIPDDAEIASTCLGCGKLLVFPPGWFKAAFTQMRADGWIA